VRDITFSLTQCEITPADAKFRAVTVIFGDGQIQRILFNTSDSLNTGDLAQHWGRPDSIERQGLEAR
jgi:hypothetical protein